jgi:hypothetical protein
MRDPRRLRPRFPSSSHTAVCGRPASPTAILTLLVLSAGILRLLVLSAGIGLLAACWPPTGRPGGQADSTSPPSRPSSAIVGVALVRSR